MDYGKEAIRLHQKQKGKIEIKRRTCDSFCI